MIIFMGYSSNSVMDHKQYLGNEKYRNLYNPSNPHPCFLVLLYIEFYIKVIFYLCNFLIIVIFRIAMIDFTKGVFVRQVKRYCQRLYG